MHPVFQVILPAALLLAIAGSRIVYVQILRARRPGLPSTERISLGRIEAFEPELRDAVARGRVLVSQMRVFITEVERLELFGAGHRALAPGQRLRFRPGELLASARWWANSLDAMPGPATERLDALGYATADLHAALDRADEADWMRTNCTNSAEELDAAIRFFGELALRINGLERSMGQSALAPYRDPAVRPVAAPDRADSDRLLA